MKRKDKCKVAAYLKVIDFCGCGNCSRADDCQLSFSLMCNNGKSFIRGFLCGADWSDENQLSVIRGGKTNTIIWHDASEKPTRSCELGYVIVNEGFVTHILCTTPEEFAHKTEWYNFRYWTYADEILPPKDMLGIND